MFASISRTRNRNNSTRKFLKLLVLQTNSSNLIIKIYLTWHIWYISCRLKIFLRNFRYYETKKIEQLYKQIETLLLFVATKIILFSVRRKKYLIFFICTVTEITQHQTWKINQTNRKNLWNTHFNSRDRLVSHWFSNRGSALYWSVYVGFLCNIGNRGTKCIYYVFTYSDQVRRPGQWRRRRDASIPAQSLQTAHENRLRTMESDRRSAACYNDPQQGGRVL